MADEEKTLKQCPLVINDIEIPFAKSEGISYKNVENTSISETGDDIVQIIKPCKMSISISSRLTASWRPILLNFAKATTPLEVKIFDEDTKDYETYSMRMTDFSEKRVPKSEDLEVTNGIWDFSYKLSEVKNVRTD